MDPDDNFEPDSSLPHLTATQESTNNRTVSPVQFDMSDPDPWWFRYGEEGDLAQLDYASTDELSDADVLREHRVRTNILPFLDAAASNETEHSHGLPHTDSTYSAPGPSGLTHEEKEERTAEYDRTWQWDSEHGSRLQDITVPSGSHEDARPPTPTSPSFPTFPSSSHGQTPFTTDNNNPSGPAGSLLPYPHPPFAQTSIGGGPLDLTQGTSRMILGPSGTWAPDPSPVNLETTWRSWPRTGSHMRHIVLQTIVLSHSIAYSVPAGGPLIIPVPPHDTPWHDISVQLLSHPDILVFLRRFPTEDWARILVLAGDQLGFFELQAPWYSNHILRLFYVCLHIYLAGVAIGRSRANPTYQPGPIFFDPSTFVAYYFGYIERPAMPLASYYIGVSNRRRNEITALIRRHVDEGIHGGRYGTREQLIHALAPGNFDVFLRHQSVVGLGYIDAHSQEVGLRFGALMIFDLVVEVALSHYDIRQHYFGLRTGRSGTTGAPSDEVLGTLAMLAFVAAFESIYRNTGVRVNLTSGHIVAGLTNAQRRSLAVGQAGVERQMHPLAFQELDRGFIDSAHAMGQRTIIHEALARVLSPEFQWPNDWREVVAGDERVHFLFLE